MDAPKASLVISLVAVALLLVAAGADFRDYGHAFLRFVFPWLFLSTLLVASVFFNAVKKRSLAGASVRLDLISQALLMASSSLIGLTNWWISHAGGNWSTLIYPFYAVAAVPLAVITLALELRARNSTASLSVVSLMPSGLLFLYALFWAITL